VIQTHRTKGRNRGRKGPPAFLHLPATILLGSLRSLNVEGNLGVGIETNVQSVPAEIDQELDTVDLVPIRDTGTGGNTLDLGLPRLVAANTGATSQDLSRRVNRAIHGVKNPLRALTVAEMQLKRRCRLSQRKWAHQMIVQEEDRPAL